MFDKLLKLTGLIALWLLTVVVLVALIMAWRHAAGEDPNVARVWVFLIGGALSVVLVPSMAVAFLIARWRRLHWWSRIWATLSPAFLVLVWLIIQTGFNGPTHWALNDWLRVYLDVESPSSAKNVHAHFGQAIGGCDGFFCFQCSPEDTMKLIKKMRVSRTDRPAQISLPQGDWPSEAGMKAWETYERIDGPWVYQVRTNASHDQVLVILWC